jgi:hypothetical protein
MRFRTKLFLAWSAVVLLLWAATLWPVQQLIWSSFDRMAAANFTGTRQSLHSLQAEQINQMRQAGSMVMNIPELRALIAEHSFELKPENAADLQERLDNFTEIMGANFSACSTAAAR